MDQEQQDGQQQQSRWQTTRRQLLWAGAIVAVLTVSILIGYRYGITLWDWIKLLVVPAVIAGGGFWFNAQQREREQRIAAERAQDDALQAYIDGMAELLTDKDQPLHSAQLGDSLRTVARARTLTVLGRLDSGRKRSVLQFLYESGLIDREQALLHESDLIERHHNIVVLRGADLSGANLHFANLSDADLSGANLYGANLCSDPKNPKRARHPEGYPGPGCTLYALASLRARAAEVKRVLLRLLARLGVDHDLA